MSEYTQMELSSEFEETADAGYNENKVSIDLRTLLLYREAAWRFMTI